MFRITESLVQCFAKITKNGSIVSVNMDVVGVMAAFSDYLILVWYTVNCTHAQQV